MSLQRSPIFEMKSRIERITPLVCCFMICLTAYLCIREVAWQIVTCDMIRAGLPVLKVRK
jgi:hypothetical protein